MRALAVRDKASKTKRSGQTTHRATSECVFGHRKRGTLVRVPFVITKLKRPAKAERLVLAYTTLFDRIFQKRNAIVLNILFVK